MIHRGTWNSRAPAALLTHEHLQSIALLALPEFPSLPAAFLVLLAAAAGTGLVPADLGPGGGRDGRGAGGPQAAGGCQLPLAAAAIAGWREGPLGEVGARELALWFHRHLDLHQPLDGLGGNPRLHG